MAKHPPIGSSSQSSARPKARRRPTAAAAADHERRLHRVLAYIDRHLGEALTLRALVGRFWGEEVYPWLAASGLLQRPRYGLSLDDPRVTRPNQCRYDAGVEVDADYVVPVGVQVGEVPGGLYAVCPFEGTSADIPRRWDRLLREWLPSSGYQVAVFPSFEYYGPGSTLDEKTGRFGCELFLPVAKL